MATENPSERQSARENVIEMVCGGKEAMRRGRLKNRRVNERKMKREVYRSTNTERGREREMKKERLKETARVICEREGGNV